jgi:hypothetical protein
LNWQAITSTLSTPRGLGIRLTARRHPSLVEK